MSLENNYKRPLSDFEPELRVIRDAGFNPIAVAQICFEDVFVFETGEEATKAYRQLERDEKDNWIGRAVGWWYGVDEFNKTVSEYEKEFEVKVLVHQLNGNQ